MIVRLKVSYDRIWKIFRAFQFYDSPIKRIPIEKSDAE